LNNRSFTDFSMFLRSL